MKAALEASALSLGLGASTGLVEVKTQPEPGKPMRPTAVSAAAASEALARQSGFSLWFGDVDKVLTGDQRSQTGNAARAFEQSHPIEAELTRPPANAAASSASTPAGQPAPPQSGLLQDWRQWADQVGSDGKRGGADRRFFTPSGAATPPREASSESLMTEIRSKAQERERRMTISQRALAPGKAATLLQSPPPVQPAGVMATTAASPAAPASPAQASARMT